MRDVAVKVQAAHTTERCFGSVGTTTEPSPGGDPRDRAWECGIETLNVPFFRQRYNVMSVSVLENVDVF